MIALGIDTSTFALSLGIVENQNTICDIYYNKEVPSGERIHILIEDMLREAGLSFREIDLFACSVGPGSFTGLRVGIAIVKGFAIALEKPCRGIPTLDGLVSRFVNGWERVVPLLDARRGKVYAAIYEHSRMVSPVMKLDVGEILKKIEGSALFLGNGATVYRDIIIERLGEKADFLSPNLNSPLGSDVAHCGMVLYKEGKKGTLEPIYIDD